MTPGSVTAPVTVRCDTGPVDSPQRFCRSGGTRISLADRRVAPAGWASGAAGFWSPVPHATSRAMDMRQAGTRVMGGILWK
jgi:hypothetical protein